MNTDSPVASAPAGSGRAPRLSAAGILAAERIKLLSLRSTWWSVAIAIVLALGLPLLLAATVSTGGYDERGNPLPANALSAAAQLRYLVEISTIGASFSMLVLAVLAVLTIGGEYGTGLIRSSYTAIPRRWPMLAAKVTLVGVIGALVGLVGTFGAYGITAPILAGKGISRSLGDPALFWPLLGAAGYVTLVALLALGIGTLVRNTAAGIGIAVGLLFVVPFVLNLLQAFGLKWAEWVQVFTPTSLGGRLSAVASDSTTTVAAGSPTPFEWWQALLLLVAWLGAVWVPALLTTMRRDV